MNTLRIHREARGLTQEKLARKIHRNQNRISVLERGARPWPHEANALAIVLGVKAETLFPDGFKTTLDYNNGSETHGPEPRCTPPPAPVFVRRYPSRDFGVMCWKCKARVTMRADAGPGADAPVCPYCGAAFGDVVPLEEAARL